MKCNGFAYLPVKKVDRVQFPYRLQLLVLFKVLYQRVGGANGEITQWDWDLS